MVGAAGGGFIFDTNALHRGEVDGSHERNTVCAAPATTRTFITWLIIGFAAGVAVCVCVAIR